VGYTLCAAGPVHAALRMTRALTSEHDHAGTPAVFLDALTEQDRRIIWALICSRADAEVRLCAVSPGPRLLTVYGTAPAGSASR
jgi:hypothetical protein